MGLMIILIVCGVILTSGEIWKRRFREEDKTRWVLLLEAIVAIVALIAFVSLACSILRPDIISEYNEETLTEVIELDEIEEEIYVNYNYGSNEYSYRILKDSKAEIKYINSKEDIVKEAVEYNDKDIRIERYKLSKPKGFWFRNLPWLTADKYVIHVPEENMIKRE